MYVSMFEIEIDLLYSVRAVVLMSYLIYWFAIEMNNTCKNYNLHQTIALLHHVSFVLIYLSNIFFIFASNILYV